MGLGITNFFKEHGLRLVFGHSDFYYEGKDNFKLEDIDSLVNKQFKASLVEEKDLSEYLFDELKLKIQIADKRKFQIACASGKDFPECKEEWMKFAEIVYYEDFRKFVAQKCYQQLFLYVKCEVGLEFEEKKKLIQDYALKQVFNSEEAANLAQKTIMEEIIEYFKFIQREDIIKKVIKEYCNQTNILNKKI